MNFRKSIATKANGIFLLAMLVATQPAFAQGLGRARGFLGTFRDEVLLFVPIVAVISLVLLALGYANKFVEKDTFVRWGVGLLIGGSATELVAMLWG